MSEIQLAKRARLESLRQRIPFVSQRALAAILGEAKRRPLPTVSKRDDIRQARRDLFQRQTPYGSLITEVDLERNDDAGDERVCCISPFAFLYIALMTCANFAALVASVINRLGSNASNPWGLIGYTDEVEYIRN